MPPRENNRFFSFPLFKSSAQCRSPYTHLSSKLYPLTVKAPASQKPKAGGYLPPLLPTPHPPNSQPVPAPPRLTDNICQFLTLFSFPAASQNCSPYLVPPEQSVQNACALYVVALPNCLWFPMQNRMPCIFIPFLRLSHLPQMPPPPCLFMGVTRIHLLKLSVVIRESDHSPPSHPYPRLAILLPSAQNTLFSSKLFNFVCFIDLPLCDCLPPFLGN